MRCFFLPVSASVAGGDRSQTFSAARGRVLFFLGVLTAGLLISPLLAHPRVRLVGFLLGIILFELVERFRKRTSSFASFAVLGVYGCALGLVLRFPKTRGCP